MPESACESKIYLERSGSLVRNESARLAEQFDLRGLGAAENDPTWPREHTLRPIKIPTVRLIEYMLHAVGNDLQDRFLFR